MALNRTAAAFASVFLSFACASGRLAVSDEPEGFVKSEMERLMSRYDGVVPGASLLVVKEGQAVVRRSWGLADLENSTPATPQTNYRLASVSKQFTATAILLLVQDGKLSLDDGIVRWFPAFPVRSVTVRQLLTHTSGIIDYENIIPAGTSAQLHDADVLTLLEKQDSTYFAPGSSYKYSNSGYALLALIVERVSGQSFSEFLASRIFSPLGMSASVAHRDGVSTVVNRAFGYVQRDGAWIPRDQSLTSAVLGDGGIYSSIDDLARWDAALYDARLLDDELRGLMFTPQTETDDPDIRYGFGWRITGESVWHSGETSGFRNVLVRFPSRRLTVVILTNRAAPPPYETALAIADLFN